MSALGQKRTFAVQKVMSALPLSGHCSRPSNVSSVPLAEVPIAYWMTRLRRCLEVESADTVRMQIPKIMVV
jgi:hypothetical protein